MLPDDIILAKEWHQLTPEEKEIVAPLATTEGEYGVLKKMLLLAQEEALAVPAINPQVQQQLRNRLPVTKPVHRFIWYAAASVLVLLLAGYLWLLPKKQDMIADLPKSSPAERSVIDTTKQPLPPVLPRVDENKTIVNVLKAKQIDPEITQSKQEVVKDEELSVTVNDHTALLDLVTEVY